MCVGKLTIFGSDNGLSPGQRQAIILTNAGILLIGPLGTNVSEILIATEAFLFKTMHLKISSAKWRPFCLGLNVLNTQFIYHSWMVNLTCSISLDTGEAQVFIRLIPGRQTSVYLRPSTWWLLKIWKVKNINMFSMNMMTSSHENILCVTGPLYGDFTGHR